MKRSKREPIPCAYLTVREAAAYLGLTASTLATWRSEGRGPAYRRHGGKVFYAPSDLAEWSDSQRQVPA